MDSSEKYYGYVEMMDRAPLPLNLVAMGSVSSMLLGLGVGVLYDPFWGLLMFSGSWYLKGWSFRKMAQETGQVCPECGGSILK